MQAFERPHHRRIGRVLDSLDGARLREYACWFGGETAIALLQQEYRESRDMDFLVANEAGYRELRLGLMSARTLAPITRAGQIPVPMERPPRVDQYGIRAFLQVDAMPLKFEIVREARIAFDTPGRMDRLHGVYTLTRSDLAASRLLANSDRWADDSTYSRDIIDLAMLNLPPRQLLPALRKAQVAYGRAALRDARRALEALRERAGHLLRCLDALSVTLPPALIQQRVRSLARRLRVAADEPEGNGT